MIILYDFNAHSRLGPLWRPRAWLLERMVTLDLVSGDLRWAMLDLVVQALSSLSAHGRQRLATIVRNATHRDTRPIISSADPSLLTPRWQQRIARLETPSDMESAA
jgi:hypothetical protein